MDYKSENGTNLYAWKSYALSFMILAMLSGCATKRGGTSGGGWPIETYLYSCRTSMIPSEPSCLTWSDYDGGFKYSGQFNACKQSMHNFTNALDEHYRCSDSKLRGIFDGLLISVPATYRCYSEFFKNRKEGDPSVECPPVEVPQFIHSYQASGLEINLGVPQCVKKNKTYNSAPKRLYQLEACHKQVEVFTGKSWQSTLSSSSAQNQYDNYLRNLKNILDQKAKDAVSKFNCIAERQKFCF